MDTRIIHEGIAMTLQTSEAPTQLKDATWSHPVRIVSAARLADLEKLIGLNLYGEPVKGLVITNAKDNQNGQTVGLVLEGKKW